jgi:hypothetical protein
MELTSLPELSDNTVLKSKSNYITSMLKIYFYFYFYFFTAHNDWLVNKEFFFALDLPLSKGVYYTCSRLYLP